MTGRYSPARIISSGLGGLSALALGFLHFNVVGVTGAWPYVVALGVLAAAAGWWAWDVYRGDRHRRAMEQFADNIEGWTFVEATMEFRRTFLSFPFEVGRNQRDVHAVRGPFAGRECTSFTHQYDEGKDDDMPVTLSWQVDAVRLPYPLSTVDIVPDNFEAKLAKLLGGQDIDFESNDFNRAWRVKAGDEKYAHDIVHPRMMERLLQSDARGMAIRIEGTFVIAWAAERHGPQDLARRLGVLASVAHLVPEHVYREYKEIHDRQAEEQRKREEAAPVWAKTPYALSSGHYTGIGAEDYPDVEVQPTRGGVGDAPPVDPNRIATD